MKIRKEAVAGTFYPEGTIELETLITTLLHEKDLPDIPPPKAIIVPHAGYVFSGSIAASAYRKIKSFSSLIKKVVILGPSHRVSFNGIALSSDEQWATPLGNVEVDQETCCELKTIDFINYNDAAHKEEHSIEVQLPFLQKTLNDFTIIPLLSCQTSLKEAVYTLEKVWGDEETLIIISSDLSHFLNYDDCRKKDHETVNAIENFDYDKLKNDDACGLIPISALLAVAKQKKMKMETLDVRCSGDTAGRRDSVVGYASFGFWEIL